MTNNFQFAYYIFDENLDKTRVWQLEKMLIIYVYIAKFWLVL